MSAPIPSIRAHRVDSGSDDSDCDGCSVTSTIAQFLGEEQTKQHANERVDEKRAENAEDFQSVCSALPASTHSKKTLNVTPCSTDTLKNFSPPNNVMLKELYTLRQSHQELTKFTRKISEQKNKIEEQCQEAKRELDEARFELGKSKEEISNLYEKYMSVKKINKQEKSAAKVLQENSSNSFRLLKAHYHEREEKLKEDLEKMRKVVVDQEDILSKLSEELEVEKKVYDKPEYQSLNAKVTSLKKRLLDFIWELGLHDKMNWSVEEKSQVECTQLLDIIFQEVKRKRITKDVATCTGNKNVNDASTLTDSCQITEKRDVKDSATSTNVSPDAFDDRVLSLIFEFAQQITNIYELASIGQREVVVPGYDYCNQSARPYETRSNVYEKPFYERPNEAGSHVEDISFYPESADELICRLSTEGVVFSPGNFEEIMQPLSYSQMSRPNTTMRRVIDNFDDNMQPLHYSPIPRSNTAKRRVRAQYKMSSHEEKVLSILNRFWYRTMEASLRLGLLDNFIYTDWWTDFLIFMGRSDVAFDPARAITYEQKESLEIEVMTKNMSIALQFLTQMNRIFSNMH